jgi:hypothetical protein
MEMWADVQKELLRAAGFDASGKKGDVGKPD